MKEQIRFDFLGAHRKAMNSMFEKHQLGFHLGKAKVTKGIKIGSYVIKKKYLNVCSNQSDEYFKNKQRR